MNPQTNLLSAAACILIRLYQFLISPFMAPRCRYLPTCSDYAQEALVEHDDPRLRPVNRLEHAAHVTGNH